MGSRTRIDCPNCGWGTGTAAAILNHNPKDYSCYCNACKWVGFEPKGKLTLKELSALKELNRAAATPCRVALPLDFTLDIPAVGRAWLYTCGISPSRWAALGIGWSERTQRVVLPVYNKQKQLVWLQQRAVHEGQKPKYLQPMQAKNVTYTNFNPSIAKVAVIVEDIASAMRVNDIPILCDGHAVMGTSLSQTQLAVLIQYDLVLVWFDPDKPGQQASKVAMRKLGLWVTTKGVYSKVDPKRLSNVEIIQLLLKASVP